MQIKGFGRIRDLPDLRDYTPEIIAKGLNGNGKKLQTATTLSPAVDNSKYVKKIFDQGNLGSCTAFMSKNMYQYMEQRGNGKNIDVSALFIYKMTRMLMHVNGDYGAYIRSALGALTLYGAPQEEYYPYNISKFDQVPPWEVGMLGQQFQVLKYFRLDKGVAADQSLITRMKQYITNGFCLGIGFTVFSSYGESNSNGGYFPYPKPAEKVEGGHAITLIGYDDTKEGGSFKLVNSWGSNWGDKGFGWIPYKYFTNNGDASGPLADDIWAILKYEYLETADFGFPVSVSGSSSA